MAKGKVMCVDVHRCLRYNTCRLGKPLCKQTTLVNIRTGELKKAKVVELND